ncbi:MAG: hypothetical protein IPP55_14605 [Anaerolineales bacterium]|nr:hypothetical protein [Anaerolineales bacterium]
MNSLDKNAAENNKENETIQNDDSNKEKDFKEQDSDKSTISSKTEGENNKTYIIGRDGKVEEHTHIHYHFNDEDRKMKDDVLQKKVRKTSKSKSSKEEQWFEDLDEYGKYYILAVCFYYGLKASDFREVLQKVRNYLSPDAKKTFSYSHSSIDIVEKYDENKLAVTVKLADDESVDRILKIIQEKHSYLLFNFVPVLREVVETQPQNWDLRWRSAIALCHISEIDTPFVYKNIIEQWAKDARAYVRIGVGYYFYYILSGAAHIQEGSKKYLLDNLDKLASLKNFNKDFWEYKWTVAAASEKIGLLEDEVAGSLANKYLEQVAGINHIRVADAVVHALVDWSIKQKFPHVFNILVRWAESGSAGDGKEDNPFEIRCIVALIAFGVITETHYEILSDGNKRQESIFPVDILKNIWGKRTKKENLWNGIITIGVRYFDFKMGNYFFEMIENWTEIVSDTDFLIQFVSDWLKEIHIIKHPKHLENRLKNVWSKSKNKKLVSIAEMTHEKIKHSI